MFIAAKPKPRGTTDHGEEVVGSVPTGQEQDDSRSMGDVVEDKKGSEEEYTISGDKKGSEEEYTISEDKKGSEAGLETHFQNYGPDCGYGTCVQTTPADGKWCACGER